MTRRLLTNRFEYGEENRLVRAKINDAVVLECWYDGGGQRIAKREIVGGVTNECQYVYDGWTVAAVLDGRGRLLEYYTGGAGLGGTVAATHTAQSWTQGTFYVHCDARGDVICVRSGASTVASLSYTPFGELRSATGSYAPRFRFSSKECEQTVGLIYFGYRWYDPTVGAWTTKDPIGISGGLNQYVFCANDPVNYTDPLGLLSATYASGGNSPPVGIAGNIFEMSYSTQDQAARFATWNIESQPYEYGGYISQVTGGYVVHPPVTDYSPQSIRLPGIGFYPDSTAWYHNHPCGGEGFSRSFPGNYGDAHQTLANFRFSGGRNATAYVISPLGQIYRMDASVNANGRPVLCPTVNITHPK